MAVQRSLIAAGQVIQHVDVLLTARGHHRQHPLHEPAPRLAVSSAAELAINHPGPQRSLGVVVRRFDPLDSHGRPQGRLAGQQLPARPRRLGVAALQSATQIIPEREPRIATWVRRVARAIVPSRTRCHQANSARSDSARADRLQPTRHPDRPSPGNPD